jgi:hypothetical protein
MLATDSIDPSVKNFSFLIVVQQYGRFDGLAMAEAAGWSEWLETVATYIRGSN